MAIKKSKFFWLCAILFNIAVISISGYLVYTRLNANFSNSPKEKSSAQSLKKDLKKISQKKGFPGDLSNNTAVKTNNGAAEKNSSDKTDRSAADKNAESPKKIKALKTVFKYRNSKAKSVSVSGSFTKWKKVKMEKKNGVWRGDIWILPGTYLFHYEVDGKKVLDSSKPKAAIDESIVEAGK